MFIANFIVLADPSTITLSYGRGCGLGGARVGFAGFDGFELDAAADAMPFKVSV